MRQRIRVAQLPLIVQAAVAVVLMAVWVWFENHIIEPWGVWRYMPLYRYGRFCTWDFLAALIIVTGFVAASFRPSGRASQPSNGESSAEASVPPAVAGG